MSGYAEEQKHYQHGRLEPIEIMQDYMEPKEIYGFCVGNAIKYILRSRFKGTELQDMEKADQYLRWGIDVLHGEKINPKKEKASTCITEESIREFSKKYVRGEIGGELLEDFINDAMCFKGVRINADDFKKFIKACSLFYREGLTKGNGDWIAQCVRGEK